MTYNWNKAQIVASILAGKNIELRVNATYDGIAALNLPESYIIMNPDRIHAALVEKSSIYTTDMADNFLIFLVLHEIGHYLYSPTYKELTEAIAATPGLPNELQALCSNIIEDCIIQSLMKKRFPSKVFKQALNLGTDIIQGSVAATGWIDRLDPNNVHSLLFYFILRGYHRTNQEIQSKFHGSPKLPWSDKTLELFDTTTTIVNNKERVLQSCGELAKSIYQDLQQANLQMPTKASDQNDQNQNKNQDQQQNQNQGQGQGQNQDQGQGQGQSQSRPMTKEELDKAIQEAAAQLNKQIQGATSQQAQEKAKQEQSHGTGSVDKGSMIDQRQLDDYDAGKLSGRPVGTTTPLQDKINGHLNALGLALYKNAAPIFARIHNEEPFWKYGLEDGEEVDEDALPDFVLIKDLHIYKEYCEIKENRKIDVTFFLDDSGSMRNEYKDQYLQCANILAALCHAFEEADIATQIYIFSDNSVKVKDTSVVAQLNDNCSNILSALLYSYRGQDTNIRDGLQYYLQQESLNDDEYIHIVFILTDGVVSGRDQTRSLIQQLVDAHVYVKGIGLDLNDKALDYFRTWLPDAKNYTNDTIVNNLGPEIVNIIDDLVHKRI